MNTCILEFESGERGLFLDEQDVADIFDALGGASDVMYDLDRCESEDAHNIFDKTTNDEINNAYDIFCEYSKSRTTMDKILLAPIDCCYPEQIEFIEKASERVNVYQEEDPKSAYCKYRYIYADGELVAIIPDCSYQQEIMDRIISHAKDAIKDNS